MVSNCQLQVTWTLNTHIREQEKTPSEVVALPLSQASKQIRKIDAQIVLLIWYLFEITPKVDYPRG